MAASSVVVILLVVCFGGLTTQFPQQDLASDVTTSYDDTSPNNVANTTAAVTCATARGVPGGCVDRQYCDYSTYAIDLTLYAPKAYKKFLWFALTVCAFAGAVYCALSQFSRYKQEPVVVSLQRDYRSWQTTFPAVTACFLDRMHPDNARDAIELHWNVTESSDPTRFQYYMEFLELVSDVSFRENLQNFWKYQEDETVRGIDLLQLALSVHPSNQLNVMLSHKAKEVQWYPVMTEVGMCMTFNSQYAEYQHMLQGVVWTQGDLLRCHYHSGQCYVRIDSIDNAVRYFIHSPYEISTAISNPTGDVDPGEEFIIDYKAVEIQASPSVKALTPEQRRCRYPDEWLSASVKAYSFALCQMHCRSRMAIMFCGCRPYFHVKGASLGGTTALFVGASVLTVVETALFIIRRLVRAVLKKIYERSNEIQFNP